MESFNLFYQFYRKNTDVISSEEYEVIVLDEHEFKNKLEELFEWVSQDYYYYYRLIYIILLLSICFRQEATFEDYDTDEDVDQGQQEHHSKDENDDDGPSVEISQENA